MIKKVYIETFFFKLNLLCLTIVFRMLDAAKDNGQTRTSSVFTQKSSAVECITMAPSIALFDSAKDVLMS